MTYGMTADQYDLLKNLVIDPLKKQNCQVFIFGSRAKGSAHSHSDVDLLFRPDKTKKIPAGFISQITENIEESRFPFMVDLVEEQYLAASYRESVFASMIPL